MLRYHYKCVLTVLWKPAVESQALCLPPSTIMNIFINKTFSYKISKEGFFFGVDSLVAQVPLLKSVTAGVDLLAVGCVLHFFAAN